jgi:hypothetical protein
MVDIIKPLCDNPDAVANPYAELQNTVLHSYGLSAHQRTVKWPDHPVSGPTSPLGPDGPAQRPEAELSGRDPEGPVSWQDALLPQSTYFTARGQSYFSCLPKY